MNWSARSLNDEIDLRGRFVYQSQAGPVRLLGKSLISKGSLPASSGQSLQNDTKLLLGFFE